MAWERERRATWKVGLFVVVGLAVASVLILALRDWRLLRSGYELKLRFESAGGLLVGAPVKYAGVEVGEVLAIRFLHEPEEGRHAEVVVWLPKDLTIRSDDEVWIGMLGLLGEKYVEILPGPGRGRVLQPGETMIGAGAISELTLARQASETLARAQRTIETAQGVLNDVELLQRLQETAEQAARLAERAEETTRRAEELLDTWQAVGEEVQTTLQRVREWGIRVLVLGGLGIGALLLLGAML